MKKQTHTLATRLKSISAKTEWWWTVNHAGNFWQSVTVSGAAINTEEDSSSDPDTSSSSVALSTDTDEEDEINTASSSLEGSRSSQEVTDEDEAYRYRRGY